ncbi:MAG: SRPBCC family protein, partial [Gemmatimonadetes bacterium]|nr:SRPBCC family protein [Gemmatimonadota bacterium]NIR36305.1 SRPBCC family protein [Actinomycetota bacterium]NIU74134.1 SRPBCC family protein [Gammaproteobacteria bacterium]NIQ53953.1 SRPBCC family protein [Gemmatimonadota bacterium]NIX20129.1 SRPBCC family protein [Actinomycetota bacterium]
VVGALLEGLATSGDRLWPHDEWSAMRFDRPLGVGAVGGHGPIRYTVEELRPGRAVGFRFTGPPGLTGIHRFDLAADGEGSVLTHTIAGAASPGFAPAWMLV